MSDKNANLWEEIPSGVYIALGRRGQEMIPTDQCWLEGCNNSDIDKLIPIDKEDIKSDISDDGSYFTCKKIKVKCKECGGIFKFAMKTVYTKTKNAGPEDKPTSFMSLMYILDENDKNLGFAGYC